MQLSTTSATRRTALAVTVVAFLTGACGGSPGKRASEPREAGVSAHSICDGTLDSSAVQALQRLAGTDRFDEATGTNEAGESRAFSLRNAVRHLHDEYGKRSACWVYRTGDNSGYPLMEIRFSRLRATLRTPPSVLKAAK